MGIYEDTFGKFFKKHSRVKLIFIVILSAYIIISGTANVIQYSGNISSFLFPEEKPEFVYTDNELKTKVDYLIHDLMDFVNERELNEPVTNWSMDFWTRVEIEQVYRDETTNLYLEYYAGDVNICYNEFKKRGKSDEMIGIYLETNWMPTNSIKYIVIHFSTWSKEL